METLPMEEQLEAFWEQCDEWAQSRTQEVVSQGTILSEESLDKIQDTVEEDINEIIEQGLMTHGDAFPPDILQDLHHLFFELALKEYGVENQDRIHLYKDNGQVGISVVEGKLMPDNARLVMQVNKAHHDKKGGDDEGVCEDCICGKNS